MIVEVIRYRHRINILMEMRTRLSFDERFFFEQVLLLKIVVAVHVIMAAVVENRKLVSPEYGKKVLDKKLNQ